MGASEGQGFVGNAEGEGGEDIREGAQEQRDPFHLAYVRALRLAGLDVT